MRDQNQQEANDLNYAITNSEETVRCYTILIHEYVNLPVYMLQLDRLGWVVH